MSGVTKSTCWIVGVCGALAIVTALPVLEVIPAINFLAPTLLVLAMPGISLSMAVSDNVHAFHAWLVVLFNWMIYVFVAWLVLKLVRARHAK